MSSLVASAYSRQNFPFPVVESEYESSSVHTTSKDTIVSLSPPSPTHEPPFLIHLFQTAANVIDDALVKRISLFTIALISSCQHSLADGQLSSRSNVVLSALGSDELERMTHLFLLIRSLSSLTVAEMIVTYVLIERLVKFDVDAISKRRTGVIGLNTIGTILLCAVIIAQKTLRDKPHRNCDWSKNVGIPLKGLNSSEKIFLQCIEYNCYVHDYQFCIYYDRFCCPFREARSVASVHTPLAPIH